jgi:hypothetical protein
VAVLMIVTMRGPTPQLLAASEAIERTVGMPAGLIARVIAPSEEGVVLVNVWASETLRRASNDDPRHRAAVQESGIASLAKETTVLRFETSRVDIASGSV